MNNLQFEIKLYLDGTVLRILEFEIELYLVRQLLEDTEGYTWIGTDLTVFVGLGHLHSYGPLKYTVI